MKEYLKNKAKKLNCKVKKNKFSRSVEENLQLFKFIQVFFVSVVFFLIAFCCVVVLCNQQKRRKSTQWKNKRKVSINSTLEKANQIVNQNKKLDDEFNLAKLLEQKLQVQI